MALRNPDDPLAAALPQQPNQTGSPALGGQPQSMTGQGAALPAPATSSSASPSGGIASVESAPLSQDRTNESRDGAGEPQIDLTQDRGKPLEYMQQLVNKVGTERVMQLAEGSKTKGRKAIDADPEQTNLTAGRMADEQGFTDDKKGEANIGSIKNMFGDQFANKVEQDVTAGVLSKKEGEKKKKKYRGLFADMSRQEISMFLWDFGGSLMANGEQGLAAAGVASTQAMAGHLGRRKEEAALGVETEERTRKAGLEEREMQAKEDKAEDTINTESGILKWNPETKKYEPMLDPQGDPYMPSALATRPPVDKWKIAQWIDATKDADGNPTMSEEEATRRVMSGETPETIRARANSDWNRFMSGSGGYITINGKHYSQRDIKNGKVPGAKGKFIDEALQGSAYGGGGAFSGERGYTGPNESTSGTGERVIEGRIMTKPKAWSSNQWDQYNAIADQQEALTSE